MRVRSVLKTDLAIGVPLKWKAPLQFWPDAVHQQRAGFAEGAELRGVAKPSSGVHVRRGRGIGDLLPGYVGEAGVTEQGGPLFG